MKILNLLFLLFAPSLLMAQDAMLKGRVVDALSNKPLPFVNVIVLGTTTGTITDMDGQFQLFGLEPGFVRLEASFVGYKKAVSSEIEINNSRAVFIELQLEETQTEIGKVTVTASPFRKTEESPVSLKTIGISEIEKSPGANRGNTLSGVLEFNQVDGNTDKLRFRGSLGASELSATFDGPLGKKTTFIVSARRSYLKLLFSLIELPFLPTFTDFQFKSRTRFDGKNELTLVGLGAVDLFDLNLVKWGFFAQASKNFLDERLSLSLGIRADANNYSKSMSRLIPKG